MEDWPDNKRQAQLLLFTGTPQPTNGTLVTLHCACFENIDILLVK